MNIGPFTLPNTLFVAPMAGVTDRPFRQLCKTLGAGYAVSEMVTSRRDLWHTLKTSRRANHEGEVGPIAVQIAGTDASMMAEAAAYNIDRGAQIIDINMGCPAKKVCNKWAGSALMQDEVLALQIVEAVVAACTPHNVPVTLKMRTGWCQSEKNAVVLARAAEAAGVQMVTVHGRTREQGYGGQAEYDTIAAVKAALRIPVVANGDITSPEKARDVVGGGLGHHRRVGAGDLHRDRRRFAFVVSAPAGLQAGPKVLARGHHLAHRVARAEALAELPERPIGDARHRRGEQTIRQRDGADAHGWEKSRLLKNEAGV